MDYCMIAFSGTHAAIFAQKLLEPVCPVQTMPVLREVSAGCGIAVRFTPEHLPAVRAALDASPLPVGEYTFYGVTGGGTHLSVSAM